MNLQESCYLELYNHVYEEIKRKEQAQIKIRRWWCLVNMTNEIVIVRTCRFDDTLAYNLHSVVYTNDTTMSITGFDIGQEIHITFESTKTIKLYLLKIILRAHNMFKLQIQDAVGYIQFSTCLQTFE